MQSPGSPVIVRMLGPLSVDRAGELTLIAGFRQAAILAVIASRPGQPIAPARLVDEVWGEMPPGSVAAALRVHVAKLRTLLSPTVRQAGADPLPHGPSGYLLDPRYATTDVEEFERLIRAARDAPDSESSLEAFDRALGLWRGEPFAGLPEVPCLVPVIDHLYRLRLEAEDERTDRLLEIGRHASLTDELAVLTRAEPLRERRTAQLMLALYRSGRQAEALAAYGRLRDDLVGELGIDPSPETRRLEFLILRHDSALSVPTARDDEWRTASVSGLAPEILSPESGSGILQGVVRSRLATLNAPDAALVRMVAILDDLAEDALLAEALGVMVTDVEAGVSRAHRVGLLAPPDAGSPRAISRSALRREVLALLSTAERAELHGRAAECLLSGRPRSAAARVIAARHRLLEASLYNSTSDTTAFLLVEAVDRCLAVQEVSIAQGLCGDALNLAGLTIGIRVDLITRMVQALSRLGEVAHADSLSRQAIELAREMGDPQRLALAVLARDWTLRMVLGGDQERQYLREALEALGDKASALRIRVASAYALESAVPGRRDDVGELIDEAERQARELGDLPSVRASLYARHASLRASPDADTRRMVGDELWLHCQDSADPEWLARAALARTFDQFVACDHACTEELICTFEAAAARTRSPRLEWHHALIRAAFSFDRGELEDSDRWAEEALVLGATAGHADALGAGAIHMLQMHFHGGSLASFAPTIEEFSRSIPDNVLVQTARALALACTGHHDAAGVALTELSGRFLSLSEPDEFTVFAAAVSAEAAVACADPGNIDWVRGVLTPYAGQFVVFGQVTGTWGPVDRLLGLLDSTSGRHRQGLDQLRGAEELAGRSGMNLWRERCAADVAGVQAKLLLH